MEFLDIAEDFLKAVTSEFDPYTSTKGVISGMGNKVFLYSHHHI